MTMETFMSQFAFNPKRAGYIGIESEAFVTSKSGLIVPRADEVLQILSKTTRAESFSCELPRCQIEWKTQALPLKQQAAEIRELKTTLSAAASSIELGVEYTELAPPDIPLDIYPNPRYAEIRERLSLDILTAGCRVAGTHVHVGMPDCETALRAYNNARRYLSELIKMGDGSCGQRISLYKQMAESWDPPEFGSWEDVYFYAGVAGWIDCPRDWWAMIRISRHGTIEFRPFGSTESDIDMLAWAERCLAICKEVM